MDSQRKLEGPDLSPYAGCWVALHGQHVVGVGHSRSEAYGAARRSRPKHEPSDVVYVHPALSTMYGPAGVADRPESAYGSSTDNPPYLLYNNVQERIHRFFEPQGLAGRVRRLMLEQLTQLDHAAEGYLVGGSVRDCLQGRESHDLDFVVSLGALEIGRRVADALHFAFYPLDHQRGVARLVSPLVAGCRTYVDIADCQGGSIGADLSRRDFTVNAMAVSLEDLRFIDPRNGLPALLEGRLNLVCSDAIDSDPVRCLRGVRLAAELGFRLDREAEEAILAAGHLLPTVSAERIRDEWVKILALPATTSAVRHLDRLCLLRHLKPELERLRGLKQRPPHALDALEHSMLTLGRLERLLWVILQTEEGKGDFSTLDVSLSRLESIRPALRKHLSIAPVDGRPRWLMLKQAALLHNLGKAPSPELSAFPGVGRSRHEILGSQLAGGVARRMKFSSVEAKLLQDIIRHHRRPGRLAHHAALTPVLAHRYFRDAGPTGVEAALLGLADYWGMRPIEPPADDWLLVIRAVSSLLRYWLDADSPERCPRLLRGDDVMAELGMPAGPLVGRLLRLLREAQVAGTIHSAEEARKWLQRVAGRRETGNE